MEIEQIRNRIKDAIYTRDLRVVLDKSGNIVDCDTYYMCRQKYGIDANLITLTLRDFKVWLRVSKGIIL